MYEVKVLALAGAVARVLGEAGHEYYVVTLVSKVFHQWCLQNFWLSRRRTSAENSVQSFTHEFYAREGKNLFFISCEKIVCYDPRPEK